MSKGTLVFTLPEESAEHLTAVKAGDLALALWDIQQKLRSWEKYQADRVDELSPPQMLELFRETFNEIMEERGLWEVLL